MERLVGGDAVFAGEQCDRSCYNLTGVTWPTPTYDTSSYDRDSVAPSNTRVETMEFVWKRGVVETIRCREASPMHMRL